MVLPFLSCLFPFPFTHSFLWTEPWMRALAAEEDRRLIYFERQVLNLAANRAGKSVSSQRKGELTPLEAAKADLDVSLHRHGARGTVSLAHARQLLAFLVQPDVLS